MRSLLGKILNLAFTGKVGFKADEVMTGTHHFVNHGGVYSLSPQNEWPMEFRVTWGSDDLFGFIKDILTGKLAVSGLRGVVDIAGLCESAPVDGTLTLKYFIDGTLRYCFGFKINGQLYVYVGEKLNLRPWNLHRTHTTCYGKLYHVVPGDGSDNDEETMNMVISESITYFRLRTVPAFLASFRLV